MKKIVFYTLTILLCAGTAIAGKVKNFKLKNHPVAYVPVNFHIIGVKDLRADTTSIGKTKVGIIGNVTTINLEGGASAEFWRYISKNMQQDDTKMPVTLQIKKLRVSEESAIIAEKSNLEIAFQFYSGDRMLMEYSGTSYVQASYDATPYVSGMISRFIETGIEKFDEWYTENKEALEQE